MVAVEQKTLATNNEELIRVEDLRTYFYTEQGVVKAVDGVNFSIKRVKFLVL